MRFFNRNNIPQMAVVLLDLFLIGSSLQKAILQTNDDGLNKQPLPTIDPTLASPNCSSFMRFTQCTDDLSVVERKEIFLRLLSANIKPLTRADDETGPLLFAGSPWLGSIYQLISSFAPGSGWITDPHAMYETLRQDPRTKDLPFDAFPTYVSTAQIERKEWQKFYLSCL